MSTEPAAIPKNHLMVYLVLVLSVPILWYGLQSEDRGPARVKRIGIAVTAVGLLWTLFAWWLIMPELVLAAGVGLVITGWLQERRSPVGDRSPKPDREPLVLARAGPPQLWLCRTVNERNVSAPRTLIAGPNKSVGRRRPSGGSMPGWRSSVDCSKRACSHK